MPNYSYTAKLSEPGSHGSSSAKGYIEAESEDQAYDKVNEMIWGQYGWVNYVAIEIHEDEA